MGVPETNEFIHAFAPFLRISFHKMTAKVEAMVTGRNGDVGRLRVECPQPTLHPHTHRIACEGFEKYAAGRLLFEDYLRNLSVDDIKWTGAVVQKDAAACAALMNLLQGKTRQSILKQFRGREFAQSAAEDLASRIFMPGTSQRSRIEEFKGRSSLATWLVGIGCRLAINESQRRMQAVGGETENRDSEPIDRSDPSDVSDKQVHSFQCRLFASVIDTSRSMKTREKLVFSMVYVIGRSQSSVAEYLGVTPPYISQILASIRLKIAEGAAEVIRDLADAADVDKSVVAAQIDDFLKYLRLPEAASGHQVPEDEQALQKFLYEAVEMRFGGTGDLP